MNVQIQSVKFDADRKLVEFVEHKMDKLDRFVERAIGADVILKLDKDHELGNKVATINLHIPGDDLVAEGVVMEAWSVEDDGAGVCFCVYVYNVQPGVEIDYATGESWLAEEEPPAETSSSGAGEAHYVLNTSSMKFHLPDCSGVSTMNPDNRRDYTGSRQALLDQGYSPCGSCNP